MSHSSGHFSERTQHHNHHAGRSAHPARRPHGAPVTQPPHGESTAAHPTKPHGRATGAPARAAAGTGSGYTLAHAGKQVRFGPVVFWIVVGTVTLLGVWSAATATYFTFRDDVLTRLIARQAEMQYAYEDRIAELRARIDRTTSRQLLDQEQFEQKLEQVMRRQAALDSRTAALSGLPETEATGSIKPSARSLTDKLFGRNKPSPIGDDATPHRQRQSWLNHKSVRALDATLARLQSSLDHVEHRQNALLKSAESSFRTRVRKMRGLIADLGLDANRIEASVPRAAVGGPYVPVKLGPGSDAFARELYRVNIARSQAERLSHALVSVPYRKPVFGKIDLSSGFGVRSDPFLGRPAMHTGLDFRASRGDPVRATAAGKVVTAGWAGGYGRMIEIDHGNGLATRYGHLSAIRVKVGDRVRTGQVVGAVGSTGRSTGPHLHYETRINGEAVDPQRFLRAGARYAAN